MNCFAVFLASLRVTENYILSSKLPFYEMFRNTFRFNISNTFPFCDLFSRAPIVVLNPFWGLSFLNKYVKTRGLSKKLLGTQRPFLHGQPDKVLGLHSKPASCGHTQLQNREASRVLSWKQHFQKICWPRRNSRGDRSGQSARNILTSTN